MKKVAPGAQTVRDPDRESLLRGVNAPMGGSSDRRGPRRGTGNLKGESIGSICPYKDIGARHYFGHRRNRTPTLRSHEMHIARGGTSYSRPGGYICLERGGLGYPTRHLTHLVCRVLRLLSHGPHVQEKSRPLPEMGELGIGGVGGIGRGGGRGGGSGGGSGGWVRGGVWGVVWGVLLGGPGGGSGGASQGPPGGGLGGVGVREGVPRG